MNVGILGTGDVGKALARGFLSRGHEVKIGTRNPTGSKAVDIRKSVGARASMGTFAEAAAFGEIMVVASLWTATSNVLQMAGAWNFKNKVVIDVTNPLRFEPNKAPELSVGFSDSAAEQIQRWLSDAKVVKAFNIIGHAHMVDPQFLGGPPDMFICGNDAAAKKTWAISVAPSDGMWSTSAAFKALACLSRSPCSGSLWRLARIRGTTPSNY